MFGFGDINNDKYGMFGTSGDTDGGHKKGPYGIFDMPDDKKNAVAAGALFDKSKLLLGNSSDSDHQGRWPNKTYGIFSQPEHGESSIFNPGTSPAAVANPSLTALLHVTPEPSDTISFLTMIVNSLNTRSGLVTDAVSVGILWVVKLIRIMMLWIIAHFVSKAYQQEYIDRAINDQPLPMLWTVAPAIIGCEACFMFIIIMLLLMLNRTYKRPVNTFVIDNAILLQIVRDYIQTSIIILALGVLIGYILQHSHVLRYSEDGIRAVRSGVLMVFYSAIITLLIPLR